MKWGRENKKKLQELIEAKLKEICPFGLSMAELQVMYNANPSLTWDDFMAIDSQRRSGWFALRQQFFDDFGMLEGLPKAAKMKKYLTLDVFMPMAVKATKISIPKDFALKFLVLGIP